MSPGTSDDRPAPRLAEESGRGDRSFEPSGGELGGFGDGRLWIGQHEVDQDILVFDPAEADRFAPVLHLYSLTQHRIRRFPVRTIVRSIHALTDQAALAVAEEDYVRRAARRLEHEQAVVAARDEVRDRHRESVLSAHRDYLRSLGQEYGGIVASAETRPRLVRKCRSCGSPLDDVADAVCALCNVVLCSCGGCGCGTSRRRH